MVIVKIIQNLLGLQLALGPSPNNCLIIWSISLQDERYIRLLLMTVFDIQQLMEYSPRGVAQPLIISAFSSSVAVAILLSSVSWLRFYVHADHVSPVLT